MFGKKRGVVVLILLLCTTVVSALNINNNEYISWYAMCYNCNSPALAVSCGPTESYYMGGSDMVRCEFKKAGDNLPQPSRVVSYLSNLATECYDWSSIGLKQYTPWTEGCQVAAEEGREHGGSGCGFKLVPHGHVFSNTDGTQFPPFPFTSSGDTVSYEYTGGDIEGINNMFFDIKWLYNAPSEFLCSDDSYWHECSEAEADVNSVQWGSDKLYICQPNDDLPGYYKWIEKGIDQDHDSYIASSTDPNLPIDCADNPSAEGLRTEGCPENSDECQYPRDSTCAICINPSAPEICGDGVDNDCSDSLDYLPDTSDDCNQNRLSCEQQTDVKLIRRGTEATFINEFNEEVSMEEVPVKSYRNDKNQAFSYNPDAEVGQKCCGYNGVSDLGNLNNDQSEICLKDDNEVVGTIGASPRDTLNFDICGGSDWCWVPASGRSKFQIATLKELGQPAYDIVSDSGKWHKCQEPEPTTPEYLFTRVLASSFEEPEEDVSARETINRFACYKEGSHSSWAE